MTPGENVIEMSWNRDGRYYTTQPSDLERAVSLRASTRPRPDQWDDYWYTRRENPTASGVSVNESTALKFSPVFAAVTKIAGTIASLPLITYREGDKGKKRDLKHQLYPILHHKPNPEQTRMQMWEALMAHLLLWGNCYCHIQQDMLGRPIALWPLDPSRMTVKRPDPNGPLVYQYRMTDSGEKVNFPPWEILHIAGLGFNGTIGYSIISLAREGIATGMAYEEYAGRFFSNNATPAGFIELPGTADAKTIQDIKQGWYEAYGGVSKSQLIGVIGQGMKFSPMSVSNTDSQFLESRRFSVVEVCRWFNIAPHMIFDLEKSSFSNIEQQSLESVIYTFRPWCVRIEQAIQNKMIIEDNVTVEHRLEGLLRGDTAARTAYYVAGIQNGYLCPNDIRELENMELIEDGDIYLRPLNMIPLGEEPPAPAPVEPKAISTKRSADKVNWEKVYKEGGAHWTADMQPSKLAQEFAGKLIDEGKKSILEIGCGGGRDSILFALAGLNVTAIDLVPKAIEIAKENAEKAGAKIDFQVGTAENLKFADGSFDSLFTLSVLHATDMKKSIPEVYRVLKTKGTALIYIYSNVEKINGTKKEFISVNEYVDLVKSKGFAISDIYTKPEEEFDEAGEKHLIIVSEVRK